MALTPVDWELTNNGMNLSEKKQIIVIVLLKQIEDRNLAANLKRLWMENCSIDALPDSFFDVLVNLEKLVINHNKITTFSNCNIFKKRPDEVKSSLSYLDCRHNQLEDLPETFGNVFGNSLSTLLCGFNRLRNLPESFLSLSKIELMDFDQNYMGFESMPRKKWLILYISSRSINQQRRPSCILENQLYLGAIHSTYDDEELKNIGITHILSVGPEVKPKKSMFIRSFTNLF